MIRAARFSNRHTLKALARLERASGRGIITTNADDQDSRLLASVVMSRLHLHPASVRDEWVCGYSHCRLQLASGLICIFRQVAHDFEELLILLADEKAVSHEAVEGSHCSRVLCRGRANDRNGRKRSVVISEEMGWLGHDQVGLQRIPLERFRVRLRLGTLEVDKRRCCAR